MVNFILCIYAAASHLQQINVSVTFSYTFSFQPRSVMFLDPSLENGNTSLP